MYSVFVCSQIKFAYMRYMQDKVLHQEHLEVREMCVENGIGRKLGIVRGVLQADGHIEPCHSLIITSGTFMSSRTFSRTYFYQTGTR